MRSSKPFSETKGSTFSGRCRVLTLEMMAFQGLILIRVQTSKMGRT